MNEEAIETTASEVADEPELMEINVGISIGEVVIKAEKAALIKNANNIRDDLAKATGMLQMLIYSSEVERLADITNGNIVYLLNVGVSIAEYFSKFGGLSLKDIAEKTTMDIIVICNRLIQASQETKAE
jgi:hypothetical protein